MNIHGKEYLIVKSLRREDAVRLGKTRITLFKFTGSFKAATAAAHSKEAYAKMKELGIKGKAYVRLAQRPRKGPKQPPSERVVKRKELRECQLIYLITDQVFVKIGISKNPEKRLKELQTSHPRKLSIMKIFSVQCAALPVERVLHKLLSHKRSSGEWFEPKRLSAVPSYVERMIGFIEAFIMREFPGVTRISTSKLKRTAESVSAHMANDRRRNRSPGEAH